VEGDVPVPAGGDTANAPGDPYATVEQLKAYMGIRPPTRSTTS
jgi:hypothetical protein